MRTILRVRLILFACALLAGGGAAFGAGEFQQARDGKTTIWNWQPKAGETASWSGDRDKEGYANGFGDLTWYNANGKVFGLFYGKMVHGKFEGGVNVHTGGRVAHSYFVNGERVTSWGRGAAKSTMTASEAALVEKSRAEAEKLAAKKEKIKRAEPVETPTPKKEKAETVAKTEPTPPAAERPTRGPETYHNKEATEKSASETVAEKKTEPLSADEELKRTEPARHETSPSDGRTRSTTSTKAFSEPTAIPKSEAEAPVPTAQPSEPEKESTPPAIQETPPIIHEPLASESAQPSALNPQPSAKETPADVSLNSLVGPPSSLRSNSSSSPENKEAVSPPKTDEPLTESEAVSLADNEARVKGCPLDSYERPKVDHSKVKGKWTLFYSLKKSESSVDLPAAFSATVEDKTRKVDIRK